MQRHLEDSFGRKHDYLRISLTDKCNFRCTYCMPHEGMKFMPDDRLMKADEIHELASIFVGLGVKKIRLTGGEPTLRKDFPEVISALRTLDVSLSLTTNGLLLDQYFDHLEQVGLTNLNISIDSLEQDNFNRITQRKVFDRVMDNISEAVRRKFKVKINVVVIRDVNDSELINLVRWAADLGVDIRFIEYMPFFGNEWEYQKVFSKKEILERIATELDFIPVESPSDSTSANYFIKELNARFGVIPTVTQAFCNGCSRIRLTADGKIKNCLFSDDESDLLTHLRSGQDVKEIIVSNLLRKKKEAGGRIDFRNEKAKIDYSNNRSMVSIGG